MSAVGGGKQVQLLADSTHRLQIWKWLVRKRPKVRNKNFIWTDDGDQRTVFEAKCFTAHQVNLVLAEGITA